MHLRRADVVALRSPANAPPLLMHCGGVLDAALLRIDEQHGYVMSDAAHEVAVGGVPRQNDTDRCSSVPDAASRDGGDAEALGRLHVLIDR